MAHRILIFFQSTWISDYSFELISIVHWVSQIIGHNKIFLASVQYCINSEKGSLQKTTWARWGGYLWVCGPFLSTFRTKPVQGEEIRWSKIDHIPTSSHRILPTLFLGGCLNVPLVGGRVRKSPKMCIRNIWMAPPETPWTPASWASRSVTHWQSHNRCPILLQWSPRSRLTWWGLSVSKNIRKVDHIFNTILIFNWRSRLFLCV